MNFLKSILGRKEQGGEFDTLFSTQRLELLRIFMAENNIPYKVRAALLPVPLNTPMPTGAMSQFPRTVSAWCGAQACGTDCRPLQRICGK